MGTIHQLAGHRAGQADAGELANWKLLAGRTADVLAALEAAAADRSRPGMAALIAETAGLRVALEKAVLREIPVGEIAREAYALAIADRVGRSPRTAAPRQAPLRQDPGGAS